MKTFLKLAGGIAVESCAIALVVTAIFWLANDNLSGLQLRELFVEIVLYSAPITALAMTLLPPIYPFVANRAKVVRWTFLIVALSVICGFGSLIGSALLITLHLVPGAPFHIVFLVSFRKAIVFALLVGVAHTSFVLLRDQLKDTQLALRTREREHERALKLAAEARLAELEARIHPHFLFNALNSISALIPSSPERAERMVERMAGLLRFTLERTDHGLVDLDRELKIVGDYLEIEQARLGTRLRYDVSTSGDLSGLRVPPLSIQTLAENSIRHGVATERKGGEVRIRAIRNGNGLTIEVADTGPGFSLAEIPAGRGLDNLRNRLGALFGDAVRFRVERLDAWTKVTFELPV